MKRIVKPCPACGHNPRKGPYKTMGRVSRLRAWRMREGLTVCEAAALLGVSPSAYHYDENERTESKLYERVR